MAINIQMKQDVSYLFSGLNRNSGDFMSSFIASGALGEYSNIKRGTYSKLMKAYYGETAGEEVKALAGKKGLETEETKSYAKVVAATDALKEAADALYESGKDSLFALKEVTSKDKDGVESTEKGYDVEAIYKAVSSFVDHYNAAMGATEDSGNSKLISKAENMANRTIANLKTLKSVGISLSEKGVLSVDKESFSAANMSTVQNLFQGAGSYGYNVSAQASLMNYAAEHAANSGSSYSASGAYSNSFSSGNLFETWF